MLVTSFHGGGQSAAAAGIDGFARSDWKRRRIVPPKDDRAPLIEGRATLSKMPIGGADTNVLAITASGPPLPRKMPSTFPMEGFARKVAPKAALFPLIAASRKERKGLPVGAAVVLSAIDVNV